MIITRARGTHQGVTQLAYVSGMDGVTDVVSGADTTSPAARALQGGLIAMGIATLLGASPHNARLVGIVGAGWALATRK